MSIPSRLEPQVTAIRDALIEIFPDSVVEYQRIDHSFPANTPSGVVVVLDTSEEKEFVLFRVHTDAGRVELAVTMRLLEDHPASAFRESLNHSTRRSDLQRITGRWWFWSTLGWAEQDRPT